MQDGGEERTKLVDDMTGSMLLDRREPGTRKGVDASMIVTTSFVSALLVDEFRICSAGGWPCAVGFLYLVRFWP